MRLRRESGHDTAQRNAAWLRQLERLLRIERDYPPELNEIGMRLVARAIRCRYVDLRREGGAASAQAKDLLVRFRG